MMLGRGGHRHEDTGAIGEPAGQESTPPVVRDRACAIALLNQILCAPGPQPDIRQFVQTILEQVRGYTGCEAAGIRLEEAGDYPFFAVQGFDAPYVSADDHLCSYGPNGSPLLAADGQPTLECVCGDIIRGRVDPELPWFTPAGSFWTGSATRLRKDHASAEHLAHMRRHCGSHGYESVAIMPLRSGGEVYGLLQLGSKRKDAITLEMVTELEPLVGVIAHVLKERMATEAARRDEAHSRALFETMPDAFAYCRLIYDEKGVPVDWIYLTVNSAFCKLFGVADPIGKRATELFLPPEHGPLDRLEMVDRVVTTGKPERQAIYSADAGRWLETSVSNPAPGDFLTMFEDISERKRLEDSLRTTQLSVDQAPDMILWVESDGRIAYANESACRFVGHSLEELKTLHLWDLDPSLSPEGFAKMWRETIESSPIQHETTFKDKNGRTHTTEISASHFALEGKELWICFVRDVTQRRETENALQRAQSSLDSMDDYLIWLDDEARIVEVSEPTCRHLEYTREELLGMTIFDIDADANSQTWSRHWREVTGLGAYRVESLHRTKSGRTFPVEVVGALVSFAGKEYDCSLCRDLSERRQLETAMWRLQYSLDHINDYPTWLDSKGQIVMVSDSTCRHLEYTREELLNMTIFDIDDTRTPENWREMWDKEIQRGTHIREAWHRTKSGRKYPVEIEVGFIDFGEGPILCGFCRDISERKQAEEAMWRLQYALDNINDYPTWFDSEGRFVMVSESTCRHLEYTREELLGMTIFDIDPDESREEWHETWQRRQTLDTHLHVTQHQTKSGKRYPVEVEISFVDFGDGPILCSFCRDISERKRLEESLRFTQRTVDRAEDMILWMDSAGQLVYANESACGFLGYSREELEALHIWELDPSYPEEVWTESWEYVKSTGPKRFETTNRSHDGREHPVEVCFQHLEFEGQECGVSFSRDISERKRLEESLHTTQLSVDQAPDMVLWVESDGRIVYANESALRFAGRSPEEIRALHLWDFDPSLSSEEFAKMWCGAVDSSPILRETMVEGKDGRVHTTKFSLNHVEFEGKELGICLARDFTERRETEEALKRAQFSLENVADYLLWLDREGRIIEVSGPTCRRLEYSREELLNMTVFDVDTDMNLQRWSEDWRQTGDLGSYRIETHHRTKSGRVFPVEVAGTHMSFGGHEYDCGFCRDISEHRQAEDATWRLQYAVDRSNDYPTWLDPEGRIVMVSESTCRHLEYTREELLGMTIFDIDPDESREKWRETWEWRRTLETHLHVTQHQTKSGRRYPVEIEVSFVDFGDGPIVCSFCRDISERKRLEESLRMSQVSVDQAPDLIIWVAPDGRIVYANQSALTFSGRSPEEVGALHLWDFDPSLSPKWFAAMWRQAVESSPISHEIAVRDKDGQTRTVEFSASHVEFEGKELGICLVRDVTERRETEHAFKDSEERYRQLFELESDSLVLADDESGAILEVNEATTLLYGYSRAELLAMRDIDLSARPEDNKPLPPPPFPDLASEWHQKKDGTIFPVETRLGHFESKGRRVRVSAIRDVTNRLQAKEELEESRQMLRLVLDTVPLRIDWRDRELRYLGCNVEAAVDAHLADTAAIVGLTREDLPHVPVGPNSVQDDLEVLRSGVPKLNYEQTASTATGPPRVFRTSKVPLRDRSGQVFGVLGVHEEITEQTKMAKALKEREEQLRQSQKMEAVGRLAGGIAHDFNNVLTTVIGYSDLLLSSPESDVGSLREDIGEIKAAAERAGSLTRQILAFSRRQALRPEVLSINEVISDTERLLARTLGADIDLRTNLSPNLGEVKADEHQFVQVLLNLAVNARDAMPMGGTLTLETANVDLDDEFCQTHPDAHPGSYIMLTITDTGTGMDADTLDHIFEPFYTTKAPGQGTGLGLATVYGIVAQSGGCTYVYSELGRGTTFVIYLPRVDVTFVPPATRVSGSGANRPKTVLVADDDDSFRALTVRILEKRGFRAISVNDGDQAMAVLEDQNVPVDLLLADIVMPGVYRGDRLGQAAIVTRPGLPVIYMSAYERDAFVHQNEFDESLEYLEKPFTAETLIGAISDSLGSSGTDLPQREEAPTT